MSPEYGEICEIMSWVRPHGTMQEQAFVDQWVRPITQDVDSFGNHLVRIGDAPILWSCHTDTVHKGASTARARQSLTLMDDTLILKNGVAGQCLGADDGAGIWLMRQMINCNVPGLYIFHRGEERGGLGSDYIAKHRPDLLDGISFAIALDRRGTDDVITHQLADRCCSEAFARQLCRKLNMNYRPCDTGVFTDTANYMHIIPECTNISVGYEREHGPTEWLDMLHLLDLRDRLCQFDPDGLEARRIPIPNDPWETQKTSYERLFERKASGPAEYDEDLIDTILDNPEAVAALLTDNGISARDILDYLG